MDRVVRSGWHGASQDSEASVGVLTSMEKGSAGKPRKGNARWPGR